jgi:tetratricopeptide (TPR) repeat protein
LYERVLTLVPNDPDALNNLGVLLSGDGEFDRALGLLRRAATIAPRNAGTWSNIGTALREQGRSNDAIAAFRHALTIDPTHQAARVGLAQQYLAISALAPAKELLDQALATNPDLAEAQYTLGQVLELQGDRAGAIRAYSTFIRVAPARLSGHAERVRQHLETLR